MTKEIDIKNLLKRKQELEKEGQDMFNKFSIEKTSSNNRKKRISQLEKIIESSNDLDIVLSILREIVE